MNATGTPTAEHVAEIREVLERALLELDGDATSGPLLRAAGIAVRIELTDAELTLLVEASEERGHHLRWSFGKTPAPAKLVLRMDSETANSYLQGRESLAVAITRGRVRCTGESRSALGSLPALRLLVEPYTRWMTKLHPHLALR